LSFDIERPGDPERLSGDHRPGLLERPERRGAVAVAAVGLGEPALQRRVAPEKVLGRHPAAVEPQLRRVRRAAPELLQLAHQLEPGRPTGDDEQRLPAVARARVDRRVDDVDVRDPAVADPDLVPVDHPLAAVAPGARAQAAHVAPALGLGHAQRGELEVARLPEALRRPPQELLVRRRLRHRRQRERRHHDAQSDPRAAPEQLLHEQRQREAGRVADQVAVEQRL
jgi:hypothetical protein